MHVAVRGQLTKVSLLTCEPWVGLRLTVLAAGAKTDWLRFYFKSNSFALRFIYFYVMNVLPAYMYVCVHVCLVPEEFRIGH